VFGFPIAIVISVILVKFNYAHQNVLIEVNDLPMDTFYSILAGLLTILGQITLIIALKYEDAPRIAIIFTFDVFIAFLFQYLFLDIQVNYLQVIGAFAIVLGTFIILAFRIAENSYIEFKRLKNDQNFKEKTFFKFIFFKF
jgi:uncharacterized membrane protein